MIVAGSHHDDFVRCDKVIHGIDGVWDPVGIPSERVGMNNPVLFFLLSPPWIGPVIVVLNADSQARGVFFGE